MTLFDARKYKEMKREQWQTTADSWHVWGPKLEEWLGPATEVMLDMAGLRQGSRSEQPAVLARMALSWQRIMRHASSAFSTSQGCAAMQQQGLGSS